jgi:hypothetical protein
MRQYDNNRPGSLKTREKQITPGCLSLSPAPSKHNCLIGRATLRTPRPSHVRIVRINRSATTTAKNAVWTFRRAKTPLAKLGKHDQNRKSGEQTEHINKKQDVG